VKQEDGKTGRFGDGSDVVIGACIEVHRSLGPGLPESAYEHCLAHELELRGQRVQRQVSGYNGIRLDCGYRLDHAARRPTGRGSVATMGGDSARDVDLVTVAAFPDVAEAQLAKERLETEGIRAFVIDAQTAGVLPFLTPASGGVRVQVAPVDEQRAREVLGS
jgi:hypothetical protein